jgi:rhodanese-related sulfurtransferase
MKPKLSICILFAALLITGNQAFSKSGQNTIAGVYKQITAAQADSLVKANAKNADFVILDVRTPSEYTPDHIEDAINRNVNDANFSTWMNQLSKQKIYLLHCQSGARSAGAFSTMKTMQFNEVYELKSGINSWKSAGLPTTSKLAPKLMLATKDLDKTKTVTRGKSTVTDITLTNRGNAQLTFLPFSMPINPAFSTNFNSGTGLDGAQDYTFNVTINPPNVQKYSVSYQYDSNGGTVSVTLTFDSKEENTGIDYTAPNSEMVLYPNPATERIFFKNMDPGDIKGYVLTDLSGRNVLSGNKIPDNFIDISGMRNGTFVLTLDLGSSIVYRKLTVMNH